METPDDAIIEIARLIVDGYTSGRLDAEDGTLTAWELKLETWKND